MKKIIAFFKFNLFFTLLMVSLNAHAAGDPIQFLQSIADQMISQLKSHQTTLKTNPSLVYSLAYKIVVPRADLDEMSKRVLPPQIWNSATPSQRTQFKHEFTTTLVRTYASALAEYNDQTIKFYPVRGGYQNKNNITVDSQIIRNDGPSISVNYRLVEKGSQWKLYDMTVEGISMLESFRSQFSSQLSRGNMNDLLQILRQHNSSQARN